MIDIWYEEELLPNMGVVDEIVKSAKAENPEIEEDQLRHAEKCLRGVVRIDKPRWIELDPDEHKFLTSGTDAHFYLVRVGFECDLLPEAKGIGASFVSVRLSAYLQSTVASNHEPSVYDLIPKDLYEGDKQKVVLRLKPEIKLSSIGSLSVGEAEATSGIVEPVIVGYIGDKGQNPYWDLRPRSQSLQGLRHLWLILERPDECEHIKLSLNCYGDIQTKLFGRLALGPKVREWAFRPSISIP